MLEVLRGIQMGTICLRKADGMKLELGRVSTPRSEEAMVLHSLNVALKIADPASNSLITQRCPSKDAEYGLVWISGRRLANTRAHRRGHAFVGGTRLTDQRYREYRISSSDFLELKHRIKSIPHT